MNRIQTLTIAALSAAAMMTALPAQAGGGLKLGEYACYSGGTALMGLAFKVLDGTHYNDLDGKSPGTYSVTGDKVAFHGGHLDGQRGADLKKNNFNLEGHGISCEPSG